MSTSTDRPAAPDGPPRGAAVAATRPAGPEDTAGSRDAGWARSTAAPAAAVLTFGLGSMYLARAVLAGRTPPLDESASVSWLGLGQWEYLAWPMPAVFVALAVTAGLLAAHRPLACRRAVLGTRRLLAHPAGRALVAAAAVALFWLARSREENLDGSLLQQKFAAATAGASAVTHDEMLELYLHLRLWELAHTAWGWDVAHTYRVVSCLAGGAAVYLALGLLHRFPPSRWPLVVGGLFTGGWILIFFGDVENYTLTNLVALAYLLAALRYLDRDRSPSWPVGGLLGIAAVCHLEALSLAPSVLVLATVAWRRGHRGDAVATLAAVPLPLAAAVCWFDHHGLPISALATHSQISAQGGHWSTFLAPPAADYLWDQGQLLLLLAPAVVLAPCAVLALIGGTVRHTAGYPTFLAAAAVGPLLMVVLWRAQLGQSGDWDLYAIAAQPIGLLVFGALAGQRRIGRQAPWLVAALALMATHTLAWVAEHHLHGVR